MKTWGNFLSSLSVGLLLATTQLAAPVSAARPIEVNIFYPGSAYNISSLTTYQQNLGVTFNSAKWYQNWSQPFDSTVAKRFSQNGFIPELTWEPQANGAGIPNADITSGKYDAYITQTAQAVKATGISMRINLAPEMNGDWSPWYVAGSGNTNETHKAFYRYVVQKFRDNGATNVQWIWAPNIHSWGEPYTFAQMYPGDAYVDILGLDGYNWGTTRSWSTWQSFGTIYGSSYSDLVAISARPIVITEIASTEIGGSKADWITDMFASIRNTYPRIQGFTWFNENKETDWRIESSQASKIAFVNAFKGTVTATATPAPSSTPIPTATTQPIATATPKLNKKQATATASPPQPQTKSISNNVESEVSATITNQASTPTPSATPEVTAALATPAALNMQRTVANGIAISGIGTTSSTGTEANTSGAIVLLALLELSLVALLFFRSESSLQERIQHTIHHA